ADRIGREVRGQNLDGYDTFQARIARPIHFAHPAGAERREDFVGAQFYARAEGHLERILNCNPDRELFLMLRKMGDSPRVLRGSKSKDDNNCAAMATRMAMGTESAHGTGRIQAPSHLENSASRSPG